MTKLDEQTNCNENQVNLNMNTPPLATKLAFAGLTAMSFIAAAGAQTFTYANNDLVLGFRKTGAHAESHEAVVNIGPAINYVNLAAGNTINVPGFSLAQLTPNAFANLDYLNWSVNGFAKTNVVSPLPGYVNNTLWLTVPRASLNVPTVAPARLGYTSQGGIGVQMNSIRSGAIYYSGQNSSNVDNTLTFIREPVNDTANLSVYIASTVNPSGSTFKDNWPQDVEITTPAGFSGSVRSDLYEVRPLTDAQGNPVVDPHTGSSTGNAYYVGYFQFNSTGTMTFTRASAVVTPPAPTLTVTRTGNTANISFLSANGATYTLYYTNSAGLTAPISTWPSAAGTISGDGSTKQFTDTTSDATRFYRVSAN